MRRRDPNEHFNLYEPWCVNAARMYPEVEEPLLTDEQLKMVAEEMSWMTGQRVVVFDWRPTNG